MVLPSRPVHYLAPMVAFAAIILLLFHLLVFPTPTSPFPTTTSTSTSTTKTLTLIPKAKHPFTDLISAYSQWDAQIGCRHFRDGNPRTRGFRLRGRWGGARQRAGQGWTWIPTNLDNLYSCSCGLTCLDNLYSCSCGLTCLYNLYSCSCGLTCLCTKSGPRRQAQRASLLRFFKSETEPLCKIDSEGKARKVVGCACVVVKDYGEESEGLHIVQEYIEFERMLQMGMPSLSSCKHDSTITTSAAAATPTTRLWMSLHREADEEAEEAEQGALHDK
ncbi:alpha-(1,4)-fucosyltransferase [Iris pallida]|uniref:Alpha-(1,4)-fucosyltransferase n=1 Tax=Iris pallida TaxID=29817 RepID=A0AAX6ETA0_IRIPA|nr:alpha-(1,4)-fucosyltransferase [Iris pallida]